MRKDKETAIQMRRNGMSYASIRAKLNIPKSTLSEWFSSQEWSQNIKVRLIEGNLNESRIRLQNLSKVRGEALALIYKEAEAEARDEFKHLKYNPLFIAGVMLYWGEGDKVSNRLTRIANSEPALIRLYISFLKAVFRFKSDELRASLLLYPDLDEKVCLDFWKLDGGLAGVPFTKTQVIKGRSPIKRLRFGVCYVNYSSSFFKKKMLTWVQLLSEELLKEAEKAAMV